MSNTSGENTNSIKLFLDSHYHKRLLADALFSLMVQHLDIHHIWLHSYFQIIWDNTKNYLTYCKQASSDFKQMIWEGELNSNLRVFQVTAKFWMMGAIGWTGSGIELSGWCRAGWWLMDPNRAAKNKKPANTRGWPFLTPQAHAATGPPTPITLIGAFL